MLGPEEREVARGVLRAAADAAAGRGDGGGDCVAATRAHAKVVAEAFALDG